MSRLPVHTIRSAPEQGRPTLERLSRWIGTMLNIHAGMPRSPVVLGPTPA